MTGPHLISEPTFGAWMGILADAIGRPLASPTLNVYRELLSQELDDEEFIAACRLVLRTVKHGGWPKPGEMIDLVKSAARAQPSAQAAFEAVYSLVATTRAHGRRWDDLAAEVAREVGAPAARAAYAMRSRWAHHTEEERQYLRRDFAIEYEAACAVEASAAQLERALPGQGFALLERHGLTALPPEQRRRLSGLTAMSKLLQAPAASAAEEAPR